MLLWRQTDLSSQWLRGRANQELNYLSTLSPKPPKPPKLWTSLCHVAAGWVFVCVCVCVCVCVLWSSHCVCQASWNNFSVFSLILSFYRNNIAGAKNCFCFCLSLDFTSLLCHVRDGPTKPHFINITKHKFIFHIVLRHSDREVVPEDSVCVIAEGLIVKTLMSVL